MRLVPQELRPIAEQLTVRKDQTPDHVCIDPKSQEIAQLFAQIGAGVDLSYSHQRKEIFATTQNMAILLDYFPEGIEQSGILAVGTQSFSSYGATAQEALRSLQDQFKLTANSVRRLMVPTTPHGKNNTYQLYKISPTTGEPERLETVEIVPNPEPFSPILSIHIRVLHKPSF